MRKLDEKQSAAVDIVNQAIEKYRASLEAIIKADDGDNDPIFIEGSTTTGHQCQLFVNPQEVARIILEYDYPTYRVLGQEAPQGMWDDLGRHFGLSEVYSFDL
jgi:hypothetical protein